MSLNYDFDVIELLTPEPVDPRIADLTPPVGASSLEFSTRAKVALFRERRTAQALREAPKAVRECFLASGFGLTTYSSNAPADRYPPQDEDARLDIIERLSSNISRFNLPRRPDCLPGAEQFCLCDFAEHVARAEPLEPEPVTARRVPISPVRRLTLAANAVSVYLMFVEGLRISGIFSAPFH